jgi:diacylglycerol O-acyltransferase / wax synthase
MAAPDKPAVKLSHRMSTQDASFLYGESRSSPLHIGSLNIFDAPIDYDELFDHMAQRMHLLPRYRQRLVCAPFNLAHAELQDDPEFDLHDHLMQHSLPEGTDDQTFLRAAIEVFEPMLDRNKPLWEMHLFQGLEGGRSAIVWKVHHALVDGVSGMELLTVAFDVRAETPSPDPPTQPWQPAPLSNAFRSFNSALFDLMQDRLNDLRKLAAIAEEPRKAAEQVAVVANITGKMVQMMSRRVVAAPWNAGLVSSTRSVAWLTVPFADLRAIRNTFGGTVNDVVLTILSEAAARYLKYHDVRTDFAPLRIGCPVNVRRTGESGTLGNRVSMMFPELSSEPMDLLARHAAVTRETDRIKAGSEPRGFELMLSGSDLIAPALIGLASTIATNAMDAASRLSELLPRLSRLLTLPPGINFIATNVPGAQVPLYLAGRKMVEMVGLVPLGANLGYNVAIVSYNQSLIFGMMAEPRLMPDVDRMRDFASDVYRELMDLVRTAEPAATAAPPASDKRSHSTHAA